MPHEHSYEKLNEHQIYCRRCGDIKSAELAKLPTYPCPLPHYPPAYYPPYTIWSSPTTTTGTVSPNGWAHWTVS